MVAFLCHHQNESMKYLLSVIILLTALSTTTTWAQDYEDLVKPTDEQVELSRKALAAFLDKDWDEASRLYQLIIDLGPLNSAYASLGFARFKAGKCEEAKDALDQVEFAPRVSKPKPKKVNDLLASYRRLLNEKCEGSIIVKCTQEDVRVSVDDKDPWPCDNNAIYLLPGPHKVRASSGKKSAELTVVVKAMTNSLITLEIPGIDGPPDGDILLENNRWAMILGGVGGFLVVSAIVVDLTVLGPTFQEFREASTQNDLEKFDSIKPTVEAQQSLVKGLLISGAAIATTGAALIIIDLLNAKDDDAQYISGWILSKGAGLSLITRF